MSSDVALERVVLEGGAHPYVILVSDPEPARLRERARESCDDRWPHWSRSYCGPLALVAGWRHRVGVDVEFLAGSGESSWSTDDEDFRSAIMTPEERKHLLTLDDKDPAASAVSLWCSKEALAKALGTPRQMDPARLTGPALWNGSRRGAWRATFLDSPVLESDAIAWVVYESFRP